MHKVFIAFGCLGLPVLLSGCAVGPGTPLVDALRNQPGQVNTNVPAPEGYGESHNSVVSSGLINPKDRKATEAYLESLANQ